MPRKEVALAKTSYGFCLKQYAPRLLDKLAHREATINDLVPGQAKLPLPETITPANARQIRAARNEPAPKQVRPDKQE